MALLNHSRAGDSLSMFEVMPHIGLSAVVENIPNQRSPFTANHNWYAIIDWEVETKSQGHLLAETKLGSALEQGLIQDAVIAQNQTQAAEILALREHMSAGQKFLGGSIKFDITVPLQSIPDFLKTANEKIEKLIPGCRPVSFGHFGDGNIHYNISQPFGMDQDKYLNQWQAASEIVFDIVDSFDGSISAEHGIGTMKKEDLARRADPVKLALLKTIKTALDPQNIMNPRVMI